MDADPTTYTLSIKAIGNGSASYNGTTIRNKTNNFTVNEGTSATITFSPDNGYRIKSVMVNNSAVSISNNQYTLNNINKDISVEVEFEAIPPTTYTLSIKVTGNGSASYNGTTIRGKTSTFVVNEGASATITFSPDNGYRIKSVMVNNSAVSVSNNQYTVSNISRDTSVEVEFEAIPSTTYTLSIKATGNGSASYNGTTIRGKTSTFTVNEGTSATIAFSPDNGYRIKSLMVNNSVVSVSNNQYTVSSISRDTSVEVEFEAIPPATYTLSIKATGNGSASYNGTTIRNKTNTFTVNEGTSATITFSPDNGYRIKNVMVNNSAVSVSNNQYTVSNISRDTSVEVEFEAIPPTTYTLSIKATGSGSASYNGTTIRNKTNTFTVNEGASATITFSPDNGYRIKSVMVNNSAVSVSNNQYTVSNISKDTSVEVEFEAIPSTTYTLTITASGSGTVTYGDTSFRGTTRNFIVNEGASVTISFAPDDGYRIKSVMVNNSVVSVSNNEYMISNINRDVSVEVDFEAIPPTTYTLTITASGSGTVTYDDVSFRGRARSFTVNAGTSATISFAPDDGYRIKSVMVNNSAVSVSNNQYTVSNISRDTSVDVEFEAIPPTTYTLSIKATGNGSALYNGTTIRGKTSTFTVNEGTSATITFAPDNGYRIKNVKVNNSSVSVSNNQYTVSNINKDTSVEVEFEAIPPTTYTLTIKATGNGSASYNGTTVRGKTSTFTVNEGASATITFSPDNGYRVGSVKVNNAAVSVSNNQYTVSNISRDTSVEVEFEKIVIYNMTIKATGNGTASYYGETVRNSERTYYMAQGASATIQFVPDNGYSIMRVTVNGADVTANVKDNSYTVSNISQNTSVEVVFGTNAPTTYALSIKATGNGSASYNGTTVRGETRTFTMNEGTSATITFSPDNGYRIKSVKVNNSAVSVSNNQYTVSNISRDTSVEVEFEAIPPTTYTLSIKSTGNGSASYNGTTVRGETRTFTVNEGTSATITFSPDNGYRIKSVKVNNSAVSVSNNQYTVSNISRDTSVEVEFEAIPPTTYTLSIKAMGNGSVSYSGTTVRGETSTFTVNEGTSATITFSPDNGYRIQTVKVNNSDVTLSIANNQYTIGSIIANTAVVVEFVEELKAFASNGVSYSVVSHDDKTVNVASGDYDVVLEVPEQVTYQDVAWKVVGIDKGILADSKDLAAVVWNPKAAFTESVSNPNLLLYVKSAEYAPSAINNVVVNGTASNVTLTDAASGNNFYCPQEFTARKVSYTHHYVMTTGIGESRGWETIALPFDVQMVKHASKGEITPFANWKSGDDKKPFWLMELTNSGWAEAASIKANTPYIISMPNHPNYDAAFHLNGNVTFSAENVTIKRSDDLNTTRYSDQTFVPNFTIQADAGCYALNVNNDYVTYDGGSTEGSRFVVNLREVHPFEAYMTATASAREYIEISEGMATGILSIDYSQITIDNYYDLQGRRVVKPVKGLYIKNGKKTIIRNKR